MKKILFIGTIMLTTALTGCGHNANLRRFWATCLYEAIRYGTPSHATDNPRVVPTGKESGEGINTLVSKQKGEKE